MSVEQVTLEMDTLAVMCVKTVDPMLRVRTTNVSAIKDIEKERVFVLVSAFFFLKLST